MKALKTITPHRPLLNLNEAARYWRAQGERTRHKLDLLGERAELETNVNMQAIKKGGQP